MSLSEITKESILYFLKERMKTIKTYRILTRSPSPTIDIDLFHIIFLADTNTTHRAWQSGWLYSVMFCILLVYIALPLCQTLSNSTAHQIQARPLFPAATLYILCSQSVILALMTFNISLLCLHHCKHSRNNSVHMCVFLHIDTFVFISPKARDYCKELSGGYGVNLGPCSHRTWALPLPTLPTLYFNF